MSDQYKMTDETAAALELSIERWRGYTTCEQPPTRLGRLECPLCVLFNTGTEDLDAVCRGCPVRAHSGISYCMETPFEAANRTYLNWRFAEWPTVEQQIAFHHAAKKEVEFLESLRKYK